MNRCNIFFLIIIFITSLRSQEIGITASQIYSDNSELQNPFGYGIFIALPSNSSFQIKFEYNQHQNTRHFYGPLSAGFFSMPLEYEDVESRSKVTSYEFFLLKSLYISSRSSFHLGIGLSRNHLQNTRQGLQSDKTLKLEDDSKWAYQIILQGEHAIYRQLPVWGMASVKIKNIINNRSVTDVDHPFQESITFIQLQLGIVFKI